MWIHKLCKSYLRDIKIVNQSKKKYSVRHKFYKFSSKYYAKKKDEKYVT